MGFWRRLGAFFRRSAPPRLHVAIDRGTGPVVILVHGIASSSVTFDRLVPLLEDRYRCIAIDLLGFGDSPAPAAARYTIEEHVAALHETIRHLRLRQPYILVGHSLGALLVSRYAVDFDREVRRLVLVSPPIYLSPNEIGDPLVRARVGAYLKVYEYLRANKDFTTRTAEVIGLLLPIKNVLTVTERNWPAFVGSLQNCIESQTTVSDVATVKVPVDVVYGAMDQFVAPGSYTVIETMRHVTMHRVPVNDHLIRKRLARAVAKAIG